MLLTTIKRSLLILSLSLATLGCQSTSISRPQQITTVSTAAIQDDSKQSDQMILKETLPALTGLAISSELLEQYHWQLVSAVSQSYNDKGQLVKAPIGNFYHPDYPISVSFGHSLDSQTVHFSSECNGSGATYTLLEDNSFKVDSIVSTDMGCGETGNRIENALFGLMNGSSSKLTLTLQPADSFKTPNPQDHYPRYNLLQTMDTGETLVWQNETLPVRTYLSSDSEALASNEETAIAEVETSSDDN